MCFWFVLLLLRGGGAVQSYCFSFCYFASDGRMDGKKREKPREDKRRGEECSFRNAELILNKTGAPNSSEMWRRTSLVALRFGSGLQHLDGRRNLFSSLLFSLRQESMDARSVHYTHRIASLRERRIVILSLSLYLLLLLPPTRAQLRAKTWPASTTSFSF